MLSYFLLNQISLRRKRSIIAEQNNIFQAGRFLRMTERDSVTRFSTLGFFHQTIPPIGSRGLNETAESDPAVSMRPRKFYDTAGILTKTNIGSHSL
jgi:hypothetical protein